MSLLEKIGSAIDRFSEKTGAVVSWLTTIIVLVVCYDVFSRYFLKISMVAIQELEWHLFAVIFLLSAAYTLRHDRHVRVDLFYSRFSEKQKALVNFLGGIFFLLPFSVLAIWTSGKFFSISYAIKETSPDPGGLPARYVLKLVIPVAFSLVLLQTFSLLIHSFLTLRKSKNIG